MTAKLVAQLAALMLTLASCTSTPTAWPAGQAMEYAERCAQAAGDILNPPAVVKSVGRLDPAPVCRCSARETGRLFPSYGEWRVAVDATRRYEPSLGYGQYAWACANPTDPRVANWCAALTACAPPMKNRLRAAGLAP